MRRNMISVKMSAMTEESSKSSNSSQKNGGRPQGSRAKSTVEMEKKAATGKAVTESALQVIEEQAEAAKKGRKRLPNGRITEIIRTNEERHCLTPDRVNRKTVMSHVLRNNPSGENPAKISPMLKVEPVIAEMCVKLGELRHPINKDTVIQLACDIIKDTPHETSVREWKQKYGKVLNDDDVSVISLLGPSWFRGFMKRNSDKLKRVRALVSDENRVTWCQYHNFKMMYDFVYERMVSAQLAESHETRHFDRDGNIVDKDNSSVFGLGTTFTLDHPDWVLFVDETGANTNMKKDKQAGGAQFIVGKEQKECGRKGASQDLHFSTLVFQTATGKPVCCCIILKSQKEGASALPLSTTLGIDVTKPFVVGRDRAETIEKNVTPNGAMCGGPTCSFKGKSVPAFIACSPNASISSQILADVLAHIDSFELFPRVPGGKRPFLLLDGHHSRLEIPFLKYITSKETEWVTCIGVPYGTHEWQLADSNECNGAFKVALYKAKQEIYDAKEDGKKHWSDSDIIPIVNKAFNKSFARVEIVKKAIVDRGWNPLNYALLTKPDILATKDGPPSLVETDTATSVTTTVNLTQGMGNDLMNRIIIEEMKRKGRQTSIANHNKKQQQRTNAQQKLREATRITSGSMAASGHFALDGMVLEEVKKRAVAKETEERKKQKRQKTLSLKRKQQYDAVRKLEAEGKTLTTEQKKIIIREERKEGDPKNLSKINRDDTNILYEMMIERRAANTTEQEPPAAPQPSTPTQEASV